MTIGKIDRVPLREVWKHEATAFTVWLQENIDVLGEAVGLQLVNVEREQSAGTFSVDLVAEDESGRPVIIENQLERSDHDHLGKIITYLTALEARTAVWVVSDPRPEHVRAIAWLNEASGSFFLLVKLEAIRIDDSPPAALFTLITGPSLEAAQAGEIKREFADRQIARHRFWTNLLAFAKERTNLHARISPSRDNWVGTTSGLPSGLALNYAIRMHDARAELYIDHGPERGDENERVYRSLEAHREEIETAFGGPLVWQPLEEKRACRVSAKVEMGGWKDEDSWPQLCEALVEAMVRLEAALRRFLPKH